MRISYNWLKQFIKTDLKSEEIADILTDLGLEVEGVDKYESLKGGLQGVVIGHVLTCEKHPDADKLKITTVDLGDGNAPVQIVCGAPNVTAGIKVIVAIPGARIADNYKIKKGKIRGMESLGMICSLAELGLPDSIIPKEFADGIQILPEDAVPGDSIFPYLDLDDEIIEEVINVIQSREQGLALELVGALPENHPFLPFVIALARKINSK